MSYLIYKATSPSGRVYVGVTNNFKRRMKEHLSSTYPFGHALRKYGREAFTYEFEMFDSVENALIREYELVNEETIKSKKLYNACIGGRLSNVLSLTNPMHNEDVKNCHPNIWSTENNPMNNPVSKQKMIESQARKRVHIEGKDYDGVREAGRQIGQSRQMIAHRLKSPNYPDWHYL